VVALLSRLIQGDPEPQVRAMAALAAADGGATELVACLVEALGDPSVEVQRHALLALGELGDPKSPGVLEAVEALLGSKEPRLRYQALVALAGLDEARARPSLLRASDDGDEEVRWVALRLLCESEALPVPFEPEMRLQLGRGLGDPSPRVRLRAAVLLARDHAVEAEAVVVQAVESGRGLERDERHLAVQAAGDSGIEAARPGLRRLAKRGWFEGPHGWAALVALARMGDAESRESIRDELRSRDVDRRVRAVLAVEYLGIAEGIAWLTELLEHPAGVDRELIESTIERLVGGNTVSLHSRSQ
jgi:HEAT repeat protein